MRRGLRSIVLIMMAVTLTACQVRVVQPPVVSPIPAPPAPAASVPKTTPSQSTPPAAQSQTPATTPVTNDQITKTGTYLGLADSYTIEVSIDGKPMALRLTDESKPGFEALKLKKDDKVEIKYQQNSNKQFAISEIRAVR